jgi:hypothetical protein
MSSELVSDESDLQTTERYKPLEMTSVFREREEERIQVKKAFEIGSNFFDNLRREGVGKIVDAKDGITQMCRIGDELYSAKRNEDGDVVDIVYCETSARERGPLSTNGIMLTRESSRAFYAQGKDEGMVLGTLESLLMIAGSDIHFEQMARPDEIKSLVDRFEKRLIELKRARIIESLRSIKVKSSG